MRITSRGSSVGRPPASENGATAGCVSLLSSRLQLFDVADVEGFTGRIPRRSRLNLSHHEFEELHTYLLEECWLLSTRFRPGEGITFSTWATRTLSLRTVDWVRAYRGRTKWATSHGSTNGAGSTRRPRRPRFRPKSIGSLCRRKRPGRQFISLGRSAWGSRKERLPPRSARRPPGCISGRRSCVTSSNG
jgi:hypothetical protein